AFALLAAVLLHFNPASLAVPGLALAARLVLKARIDGLFGTYAGPLWLMPLRDLLSFAVFLASLSGESVHWRGTHFAVEASGAMSRVDAPNVLERHFARARGHDDDEVPFPASAVL